MRRQEYSYPVFLFSFNYTSNPQLSPSMSFLRVHVLSLLNYHIN